MGKNVPKDILPTGELQKTDAREHALEARAPLRPDLESTGWRTQSDDDLAAELAEFAECFDPTDEYDFDDDEHEALPEEPAYLQEWRAASP
ncbi:hypothetical protein ABIE41_002147 [Bosea sp. OAE506]|uniref:hypothetical protein n=1 Tax=Bosea sp. OAE506 TaxID=2663870 RepID=UPI00178A6BD0